MMSLSQRIGVFSRAARICSWCTALGREQLFRIHATFTGSRCVTPAWWASRLRPGAVGSSTTWDPSLHPLQVRTRVSSFAATRPRGSNVILFGSCAKPVRAQFQGHRHAEASGHNYQNLPACIENQIRSRSVDCGKSPKQHAGCTSPATRPHRHQNRIRDLDLPSARAAPTCGAVSGNNSLHSCRVAAVCMTTSCGAAAVMTSGSRSAVSARARPWCQALRTPIHACTGQVALPSRG